MREVSRRRGEIIASAGGPELRWDESYARPVRGRLVGKRQTLKLLCKHQFAFHEKYGNDASPDAFESVQCQWAAATETSGHQRASVLRARRPAIEVAK